MYGDHSPEMNPVWPRRTVVIQNRDLTSNGLDDIWNMGEFEDAIGDIEGQERISLTFANQPRKAELFSKIQLAQLINGAIRGDKDFDEVTSLPLLRN